MKLSVFTVVLKTEDEDQDGEEFLDDIYSALLHLDVFKPDRGEDCEVTLITETFKDSL